MVHRLDQTTKAVYRVSLTTRKPNFYCEQCRKWFPGEEPTEEIRCPYCDTTYEIEFAVYTAVEDEPDAGETETP